MARPQSGETKAPIIIALAFFVLTTLALGILTYMAYDEKAVLRAENKKAADDKTASEKLRAAEQEKLLVYKVALGLNTQEEFENLKNARNETEVRNEYNALMDGIKAKLQGSPQSPGLVTKEIKNFTNPNIQFDVKPEAVVQWIWPAGGKLEKEPDQSILAAIVSSYAQRQLSIHELATQQTNLKTEKDAYKDASDRAKAAEQTFKAETAKIPGQVDAAVKSTKDELEKTRKDYKDETTKYIKDVRDQKDQVSNKDIQITQLQTQVAGLREQVAKLESQLEVREDPFSFDKPHGKILRRKGNIVDINLGSADNVRAGLTFSVQPSDTPERGLQSRMRPRVGPNGKPVFENDRPVMDILPKGTIEVIEVLGPNLSQARITSQVDLIREGILAGDVIYNSAWRKGAADHVALYGVFDVDADGTDDIQQVIRDLTRMGIVVDAYYDLSQKKWVGKLTEQTVYAVEGYFPAHTGGDALLAAKSAIDIALRDARQQSKERGAKVVKSRDFFPRMGYRIRLDITPDTINRAYTKYLSTLPINSEAEQPK